MTNEEVMEEFDKLFPYQKSESVKSSFFVSRSQIDTMCRLFNKARDMFRDNLKKALKRKDDEWRGKIKNILKDYRCECGMGDYLVENIDELLK